MWLLVEIAKTEKVLFFETLQTMSANEVGDDIVVRLNDVGAAVIARRRTKPKALETPDHPHDRPSRRAERLREPTV